MRRTLFLPLFAAAVVLLCGAGPQPRRPVVFTTQQLADLDRVDVYLNAIHTLKSNFVQLGPDGQLDQGTLFIQKPGQMRFAYDAPSPTLIVATNDNVYVQNARLNTVDRYSLSNTPLGLLLDENMDLKSNRAVLGVEEQNDALVVHARSSNNRSQSDITLVFSFPGIELRQWMVRDNQGGTTTVALTGLQTNVALDPSLFVVPVKAPKIKKGG